MPTGPGAWASRAPPPILGGRGRRSHDQRDLAFPGELDGDLLPGGAAAAACWSAEWSAPCRSWRPMRATWAEACLTSRLIRRGLTTTSARKVVMVVCLALVSCAGWVGFVQSQAVVIGLLCLAAMGTAAYMVNYFAFGQDVAPGPYRAGDRLSWRPGQPLRRRLHARGRLDLRRPVGLRAQLPDRGPAAL